DAISGRDRSARLCHRNGPAINRATPETFGKLSQLEDRARRRAGNRPGSARGRTANSRLWQSTVLHYLTDPASPVRTGGAHRRHSYCDSIGSGAQAGGSSWHTRLWVLVRADTVFFAPRDRIEDPAGGFPAPAPSEF